MKIALPIENKQIFQHFGRSPQFIIYTVEDNKITEQEFVSTQDLAHQHQALAQFFVNRGVEVLIVGGIGAGAQAPLKAAGIQVVNGATGDVEENLHAYLRGELQPKEGHSCGCGGHDHDHHHHDHDHDHDHGNRII